MIMCCAVFETLLLSDDEVASLLSMREVMEVVEAAFREKGLGRVQMPSKIYLFFGKYNGDLRAMPSYLEGMDIAAVKVVNVHPENKEKYGLPTVMATIILVDPKSGFPLAIMGGTTITNMRTGAAGGIAAKYLARRDSRVVGFIGAGAQARTQLMGLLEVFGSFEEVRVWDRSVESRVKFRDEMMVKYGDKCRIILVDRAEDAVRGLI